MTDTQRQAYEHTLGYTDPFRAYCALNRDPQMHWKTRLVQIITQDTLRHTTVSPYAMLQRLIQVFEQFE